MGQAVSGPDPAADFHDYQVGRHWAGECSPACRAPVRTCGHCFYDHAIALMDHDRHSCTTGCGCTTFTDTGLTVQALAIIGVVREAAGIPHGASVGDGEAYQDLLAKRVMHLNVALANLGRDRFTGDRLEWTFDYLRGRLAENPVTYRTSYAEVLADMRAAENAQEPRR